MAALLEVRDLDVSYGSIEAVRGLTFSVEEGQHRLHDRRQRRGQELDAPRPERPGAGLRRQHPVPGGRTSPASRADRIVRAGLVQVPEGRAILAPLTVDENLELGGWTLASEAR